MSDASSPACESVPTLVWPATTRPTIRKSSMTRHLPGVGFSYSFVKLSDLAYQSAKGIRRRTSKDTGIIIESCFFPSLTAKAYEGRPRDMSAEDYNELMSKRFRKCIDTDVPVVLGHMSRQILMQRVGTNHENTICEHDPTSSIPPDCPDEIKSIMIAFGKILRKKMDDKHKEDGATVISSFFVEPSEWGALTDENSSIHKIKGYKAMNPLSKTNEPVLYASMTDESMDLHELERLRIFWRMEDGSVMPMDGKR